MNTLEWPKYHRFKNYNWCSDDINNTWFIYRNVLTSEPAANKEKPTPGHRQWSLVYHDSNLQITKSLITPRWRNLSQTLLVTKWRFWKTTHGTHHFNLHCVSKKTGPLLRFEGDQSKTHKTKLRTQ